MPSWKMFSADDHVDLHYLPGDLWEKRVSARFRDRVPRLVEDQEGWRWEVNGKVFGRSLKWSAATNTKFGKSDEPIVQEPGRWRPTTPELRMEDMDRDGVDTQVMYGGAIVGFQLEDPEANSVGLRAYNEWVAEFCSVAPERLIGLGFVPVHDGQAAVEELYNCARLGLKGVQFQAFDSYRQIWDEVWEPLWSAAEETGLPVAFHVGGGTWIDRDLRGAKRPARRGLQTTGTTCRPGQLDEILVSLVFSGIMKDHPKLKTVLGESSIGWIPYVLERMDREYTERIIKGKGGDIPHLDLKPSEYWRRQMYATFQEDPIGVQMLDYIGADSVLWASDYPHGDSVWPLSHETVERDFAGVDEAIVRKVTRENGRKLYLGEE